MCVKGARGKGDVLSYRAVRPASCATPGSLGARLWWPDIHSCNPHTDGHTDIQVIGMADLKALRAHYIVGPTAEQLPPFSFTDSKWKDVHPPPLFTLGFCLNDLCTPLLRRLYAKVCQISSILVGRQLFPISSVSIYCTTVMFHQFSNKNSSGENE
jgi:hypothetical protein